MKSTGVSHCVVEKIAKRFTGFYEKPSCLLQKFHVNY